MIIKHKNIKLDDTELSQINRFYNLVIFLLLRNTDGQLKKNNFSCRVIQNIAGEYYDNRDYYVIVIKYNHKKVYTVDFQYLMGIDLNDVLTDSSRNLFTELLSVLLMKNLYTNNIIKIKCELIKK